jgi:hypothetical protein
MSHLFRRIAVLKFRAADLRRGLQGGLMLLTLWTFGIGLFGGSQMPNPLNSSDPTGTLSTYSTAGGIDISNPFFQNLGTNGRTCNTCHVSTDAWSVAPPDIQARFNATEGLDPIFRPVDGSNCPSDDVSSLQARQSAYSLLLNKGLIRISLPVPANAEFAITDIRDPYDCPETTETQPAMYRRPLPATNLPFLSAVMWDGRETVFGSVPGKSINLTQSLNQCYERGCYNACAAMIRRLVENLIVECYERHGIADRIKKGGEYLEFGALIAKRPTNPL